MFSALENIFINKLRQTETTDTRQEIRRHDPEYEQRKHKKKKTKNELFDEQDSTIVSIDSLSIFLKNFLKSLKTEENQEQHTTNPQVTGNNIPKERQSSEHISRQAAQAYQTTDQSLKRSSAILNSTDETTPDLGLKASEVRTIHTLIDDLKTLSDQQVEFLRIERSNSFLESITNAIAHIKK
ncbi:MAG: hypothetical protein KAJ86_05425 [Alphaproteobacteria bacterium]|nr:hypothetical protein [Alphaproteobacteria bacterium]